MPTLPTLRQSVAGNSKFGDITACTRVQPAALKKKNPTTHKRPAKINPRIAAQTLDELIRPLWAESKGFQYIP
jgi:hypothetical protein